MDVAINVFVNIAPFLLILIFIEILGDMDMGYLSSFILILFHIGTAMAGLGYGNFLMSMIALILQAAMYASLIPSLSLHKKKAKSISKAYVRCFLILIYSIYLIYNRLKHEGIIKIIMNIILNVLENVMNIILNVLENEWFKGIAIAVISGVIVHILTKRK